MKTTNEVRKALEQATKAERSAWGRGMTKHLYLTIFDRLGNLVKTDCGTIKTVDKWIARGYVVSYTDDSKTAAAILEAYENEMRNTYKGKTMRV